MYDLRNCFFSFHYDRDHARAAEIRNVGVVEGNKSVSDNDWESIALGGVAAIEDWIDKQVRWCDCTIVLVGTETEGYDHSEVVAGQDREVEWFANQPEAARLRFGEYLNLAPERRR